MGRLRYATAMPAAAAIDDLFGHVPQTNAPQRDIEDEPDQASRHDSSEAHYLVPTPYPSGGRHTADSIREQVMKIMAVVREADSQPFADDELHNHNVWMPYYCEWLKNGEGDALLAEYRARMEAFAAPGL